MENSLELLGNRCRDTVTGFTGVCTAILHEMDAQTSIYLTPPVGPDDQPRPVHYFRESRVKLALTDTSIPQVGDRVIFRLAGQNEIVESTVTCTYPGGTFARLFSSSTVKRFMAASAKICL